MSLYDETDCLPHVKPDGGPAFPAQPTQHYGGGVTVETHNGMSLRDWFAGRAPDMPEWWEHHETGMTALERIASWSYAYADTMLAVRADAVLREAEE